MQGYIQRFEKRFQFRQFGEDGEELTHEIKMAFRSLSPGDSYAMCFLYLGISLQLDAVRLRSRILQKHAHHMRKSTNTTLLVGIYTELLE